MNGSLNRPSVNALAKPLVERFVADAHALRLSVTTGPAARAWSMPARRRRGSIEAGRRIAEICLGGLGSVEIVPAMARPAPGPTR